MKKTLLIVIMIFGISLCKAQTYSVKTVWIDTYIKQSTFKFVKGNLIGFRQELFGKNKGVLKAVYDSHYVFDGIKKIKIRIPIVQKEYTLQVKHCGQVFIPKFNIPVLLENPNRIGSEETIEFQCPHCHKNLEIKMELMEGE